MKYYIHVNGANQGPYTVEELMSMGIQPTTPVWNETMAGWQEASTVEELRGCFYGAPGVPPQYGFNQQYGYNQPQPQKPACPKTWLVESILATIFCCLPFGIVGIVKAAQVEGLYQRGDYEGALKASRDAGKWTRLSVICALAIYVIYLLLIVFGVSIDYLTK